MFCGRKSLILINLDNFNTNKVTNMSYLFKGCYSLASINLSNFNTNNVNYMSSMFENCYLLASLNIENFNCDNIKTTDQMNGMFKDCRSLKKEKVIYKDSKINEQLLIDLK